MSGFAPAKMKRKDLEDDVLDDFADFSLATPARKTRRLNGVMPPIIEEEPEFSMVSEDQFPGEHLLGMKDDRIQSKVVITEIDPPVSLNEERSLVLYKPVNSSSYVPLLDLKNPLSKSISLSVNAGLYPDLKFQLASQSHATSAHAMLPSDTLAIVPWVPVPHRPASAEAVAEGGSASEPMEAEVETHMKEDDPPADGVAELQPAGLGVEGLQWQQHCMTPHPLQTTKVMWSW